MDFQNHAYALTQIAHNFGAVVVVAAPLCVLFVSHARQTSMAYLTLIGWAVQVVSGVAFGLISFYYYGALPDIHGTAVIALVIKIACAVAGVLLSLWLARQATAAGVFSKPPWLTLACIGPLALTAAAVLRWFS